MKGSSMINTATYILTPVSPFHEWPTMEAAIFHSSIHRQLIRSHIRDALINDLRAMERDPENNDSVSGVTRKLEALLDNPAIRDSWFAKVDQLAADMKAAYDEPKTIEVVSIKQRFPTLLDIQTRLFYDQDGPEHTA